MKTPELHTPRLLLREIRPEDVSDIFQCWMQDEEVSRYMWWKASREIRDAEDFVRYELEQQNNDRWFRWVLVLPCTGTLIGTCLVYYNEDDTPVHWDVSYNLGKEFWGNGYATEAMREVLRFAETELGMQECITSYADPNRASAHVLHKLGFEDIRRIPFECSGGEFVTEGTLCRYVTSSVT